MNKKITIILSSLIAASGLYAADDGSLSATESFGQAYSKILIEPNIKISRLGDINFSSISDPSSLASDYEQEKSISFCVYSNSDFKLSIEPEDGDLGMINDAYVASDSKSAKDHVPVTYTVQKNQISEGSINGDPVDLALPFAGSYTTVTQTPVIDIMNENCQNLDLNELDNYILKAKITGKDIKNAATGYYITTVTLRAGIVSVGPL